MVSLKDFDETTNDYFYIFGAVQHFSANIYDKLGIIPPLIELSSESKKHTREYSTKNNSSYSSDKLINPKTLVGTDSKGNVYLVENLIDNTVLLTYTEKDDYGKRLNYKSIEDEPTEKDWLYSDSDFEGNVNIGITKNYFFEYNEMNSYGNNIKISAIIYVDNFLSGIDSTSIKDYSGYYKLKA